MTSSLTMTTVAHLIQSSHSGGRMTHLLVLVVLIGLMSIGTSPHLLQGVRADTAFNVKMLVQNGGVNTGTTPPSTVTACDGEQLEPNPDNAINGTCVASSASSSIYVACYPDGSQTYDRYYGSNNCTVNDQVHWTHGSLPPGSVNQCMPTYAGFGDIGQGNGTGGSWYGSFIMACDYTGGSIPETQVNYYDRTMSALHGSTHPLTSDTNITNVEYYTSGDCSGTPRSILTNITNGGCINDPLGPGTAQSLSCRYDGDGYPTFNFQYVQVWAGQTSPGVPNNCPATHTGSTDNGNMWGFRKTNYGECITLWLNYIPYGSYKFTCPSFPITKPSSSTGHAYGPASSSSSATAAGAASSSGVAVSSSSSSTPVAFSSSTASNGAGVGSSTGADDLSGSMTHEISLIHYSLLIIIGLIIIKND